MKKMTEVTKNTTLAQVLKNAGAERILERHGAPCTHCPMAALEMGRLKLGEIAGAYGLDLKAMLRDLNKPGPDSKTAGKGKK